MPTALSRNGLYKLLANRSGFLIQPSTTESRRLIHHGNKHSSITAAAAPPNLASLSKEVDVCYNKLDLSFENGKEAFKSKTNWELMRSLMVLRMCNVEYLVKYNDQILKALRRITGASLFKRILKASFYGHFVAGETRQEVLPTVEKLAKFGVKSILDYSVESDLTQEEAEERAVEGIVGDEAVPEAIAMQTIVDPKIIDQTHERYSVHKEFGDRRVDAITGSNWENLVLSKISQEDFMRRLSEFGIKTDTKNVSDWFKMLDFDEDGFVDFYDWGQVLDLSNDVTSMFKVLNIRTGKLEPLIVNLTKDEERECTNMIQRIVRVADYAADKGIRIMIDAEQTYFQPAISRLTIAMMRKYNKNSGQILNTYQAYLKNGLANLKIDMHLAKRENFHFGCKLVRGAYMDQERKRAEAIGYPDPINVNYNATTQMYHRCLDAIAEESKQRGAGNVSVMVASHNEESVRYAVQLMKDHNIAPSERIICFAQLYGMCDQVSFSLGQAGYSIYKYLPYGPVEDVLPYLSRRAQENGSLLKTAGKERNMLWEELKRRLAAGEFVHTLPV